jgi:hypothetical protein
VPLPFQTVETVNESAQERQKSLSLFESPGAYHAREWRNRVIWGDKKYVLPSLLAEFAGNVNLIPKLHRPLSLFPEAIAHPFWLRSRIYRASHVRSS